LKYNIKVNEKQLKVLIPALESYLRLGLGQLENVLGDLAINQHESFKDITSKIHHDEGVKKSIEILKSELFGCSMNASKGICSPDVHSDFKLAYEMYQKMRQISALQRKPEGGWSKDFDEPLKISGEELIEIEVIKE